jgi:hypothetical protein
MRRERVSDVVLRFPPLRSSQVFHQQASHAVIEVIVRIRGYARIARVNDDI